MTRLPNDQSTEISIPTNLFKALERKIEGTNFHSVSDYVTYLLNDVVRDIEKSQKEALSEEDEKSVQDRLRALGYV